MNFKELIFIIIVIFLIAYFTLVYRPPPPIIQRKEDVTSLSELEIINLEMREIIDNLTPEQAVQKLKIVRKVREEECRKIFEDIFFPHAFPSTRPNFLKNPRTNRCLELDGYNEKLSLAFEYNGYQHYIFPNCFHTSKEQFEAQVWRDKFKTNLCKKHNIRLITIPYTVRDLRTYIKSTTEDIDVGKFNL